MSADYMLQAFFRGIPFQEAIRNVENKEKNMVTQPQIPNAPQAETPEAKQPKAVKPSLSLALPTEKSKPKSRMEQYNWLLYGPPKVGKTSFANQFDMPLILSCGSGEEPKHLEAYFIQIESYQQIVEVGQLLKTADHQFKTLVIDTVDEFVRILQEQVCREENQAKIELVGGGYGIGYKMANERMLGLFERFKSLGLGLVLISHAEDVEIKTDLMTYTKTTASLSPSTRKAIMKWVDVIGYAKYDAQDSARRVIVVKGNNNLDAGARTAPGVVLPEQMPLDYHTVKSHFEGKGESK